MTFAVEPHPQQAHTVHIDAGGRASGHLLNPGESVFIGADARCDLVVSDSGISPLHCGLRHRGQHIELWDCSKDGSVHVAGAQVVRVLLPLDGSFSMGRASVRLSLVGAERTELLPAMIGTSEAMQKLARVIRRSAKFRVPVLLRGESGTGKELAARAIHALSGHAAGPFVAVNGASLSDTLAASTLFGHEEGAFTGARDSRLGAFRQAHGGTLFIDEVAAIPLDTQALLLRTLEDLVVKPVGGDEEHPVDVRIVTATCEDLDKAVRRGRFRPDLYQRIATCIVRIPSLRERRPDLRDLAEAALSDVLPGARLHTKACTALRDYAFPGNVRELKNIVLQAALRSDDGLITAHDLGAVLRYRNGSNMARADDMARGHSCAELLALLERHRGNLSKASRIAGLPRSTFRDRIRRAKEHRHAAGAT